MTLYARKMFGSQEVRNIYLGSRWKVFADTWYNIRAVQNKQYE